MHTPIIIINNNTVLVILCQTGVTRFVKLQLLNIYQNNYNFGQHDWIAFLTCQYIPFFSSELGVYWVRELRTKGTRWHMKTPFVTFKTESNLPKSFVLNSEF